MAIKNADGSVTMTTASGNRVTLSPADLAAAQSASTPRPLVITTGKGRVVGASGEPRYGIFYDTESDSFHFLDKDGDFIPNSSWRPRNLNKASFKFSKPA